MKKQEKNKSKSKWIDGRLAQGAWFQWLVDKHPELNEVSKALMIIARYTLGYRKRYAYIKDELFGIPQSTKWRQIKKAKDLGLLEYKRTKGYTMYRLILPREIEDNVAWIGSKDIEKRELIKEELPENTKGW